VQCSRSVPEGQILVKEEILMVCNYLPKISWSRSSIISVSNVGCSNQRENYIRRGVEFIQEDDDKVA
jgi:hypothetical protein